MEQEFTLDYFPEIKILNNLKEEDKNIIWECIRNMVYTNIFFKGNDRRIVAKKNYIENNVYKKLHLESNNKKKIKQEKKEQYNTLKGKDILVEKLYEILILDERNTLGNIINFINTYGQVKDNKDKFVNYCKQISLKLDISKDYDSKVTSSTEPNKNDDDKDISIESKIGNDYNSKYVSEYEKQQEEKEELAKNEKQYEEVNELTKYFYYIFKEIENKYSKYLNMFIISYYIHEDILKRNKNLEPTNMDRLFWKEDKINKLIRDRETLIKQKEELEYEIENNDLSLKKNIKNILKELCLRPQEGHQKDDKNLVADKTVEKIYKMPEAKKRERLKEKLRIFLLSKVLRNLTKTEKEKELNEILDPLSFWDKFYSEFQYKIENTTYYSLLESVDSRPDRRKEKMCEILDDIFNNLEGNKYRFDSEEDREIIIELDDMIKRKIIEFIKLSIPNKNIRENKEKGKNRQKVTEKNLKEHKIKRCDGYKEDIGHYITDNDILTEEAKKELQEHLIHCDDCLKYLNDLQSGNKYLNEELEKGKSFQYDKKYNVIEPVKILTHNEEIIEFFEKEFNKEPNNYTCENLILAYIKTGNIKKAEEFYNKSIDEIYEIINNKEVKNG